MGGGHGVMSLNEREGFGIGWHVWRWRVGESFIPLVNLKAFWPPFITFIYLHDLVLGRVPDVNVPIILLH